MNKQIAAGLVAMHANPQSGVLTGDYCMNKQSMGTVKMTAFANKFAAFFK